MCDILIILKIFIVYLELKFNWRALLLFAKYDPLTISAVPRWNMSESQGVSPQLEGTASCPPTSLCL